MSPDNCERIAVKRKTSKGAKNLTNTSRDCQAGPAWRHSAHHAAEHWDRGGRTRNTRRIDVECRQVKKEMVRLSSPPDTCLLSNDSYRVLLTAAGAVIALLTGWT